MMRCQVLLHVPLLFLLSYPVHAQRILTTVAGSNLLFQGDGGPAANAFLGSEPAVSLDSSGRPVFSDPFFHLLLRVEPSGVITAIAGNNIQAWSGDGGPARSASLNTPQGTAYDAVGNLYIADATNNRIRIVSPQGIITTFAGDGQPRYQGDNGPAASASLYVPLGVAIDGQGNIYVNDAANARIRKINPQGIITTLAGNGNTASGPERVAATSSPLNLVGGIAVDAQGSVYLAETGANRVRKISMAGIITTVAGTGTAGDSGDGGPALQATLNQPGGVAVDRDGNLLILDSTNQRLRKVTADGLISPVAGNGTKGFSGDGGPAANATFRNPQGVAASPAGDIYIADTDNHRIRHIDSGYIITTVAGKGSLLGLQDGVSATTASLVGPFGVSVDSNGCLLVADTGNNAVRRACSGVIKTIAGNGAAEDTGDGGPAVKAGLNQPVSATDIGGNIYIADTANYKAKKVDSSANITTAAGNGSASPSGDGGDARRAGLAEPFQVVADTSGNLYIADHKAGQVRKVSPNGIISTFKSGLPTSAALAFDSGGNLLVGGDQSLYMVSITPGGAEKLIPSATGSQVGGIAVDGAGNIYFSDGVTNTVKEITLGGSAAVIAGNGHAGYSGDGGPATSGSLNFPRGIAIDKAGTVYIAELYNNKIRAVLPAPPAFAASTSSLSLSAAGDGASTVPVSLSLSSSFSGLAFSVSTGAASWLNVTPATGVTPGIIQVSADPTGLAPGSYRGTVMVAAPGANPPGLSIIVNLAITPAVPPQLDVDTGLISFSYVAGASPETRQILVRNSGSGLLSFTATASTATNDCDWLAVRTGSGTATPNLPGSVLVTIDPSNCAPNVYSGTVTIQDSATGAQASKPVTITVSPSPVKLLLSQTGLTFTALVKGGVPLPQTVGILNAGLGSMDWQATAATLPADANWLRVSASSGTVARASLDVFPLGVSIDANALNNLAAGTYSGQVTVSATGASNSPQVVTVLLKVQGASPGPEVRPTGLIFTGVAGGSPGSQIISVGNPSGQPVTYSTSAVTQGGDWLVNVPTSATVAPGQPGQIVVQPDLSRLTSPGPQTVQGELKLRFGDGTTQSVSVLLIVAPSGGGGASAAGGGLPVVDKDGRRLAGSCLAKNLYPVFTELGSSSVVPAGWPVSVQARVADDCGSPMASGSVVATFGNGDPAISLTGLQNGLWSGTWQPRASSTAGVTISLRAQQPELNLKGTTQLTIGLQASLSPPVLSRGPVSAAAFVEGPLAPGDLVLLQGSGLADGQSSSTSVPLSQQLAGVSVVIGGRPASLLYADDSRVIGLVPLDLPANTQSQILVQHGASLGVPSSVVVAATQPAIFTRDSSGQGQGMVYQASQDVAQVVADASNPVQPGDTVIIYCTGLGVMDDQGAVLSSVSVSVGGQPAQVTYAGTGLPQSLPPEGAPGLLQAVAASPGFVGLYQVNATVPDGVADGEAAVTVSAGGQSSQPGVTLSVRNAGGSSLNERESESRKPRPLRP